MSKSYTKKAITIEAIQLKRNDKENNTDAVLEFCKGKEDREAFLREGAIYIKTLEGLMLVSNNDYVIKGIKGEYYPCKPDIFEASYSLCSEEQCNSYVVKNINIEALKWKGDNFDEVMSFCTTKSEQSNENFLTRIRLDNQTEINETSKPSTKKLIMSTLQGEILVNNGDYIIRDKSGKYAQCKACIFDAMSFISSRKIETNRKRKSART